MKEGSFKTNILVQTAGGLWSAGGKDVLIEKITWYEQEIGDDEIEVILEVYFSKDSWNINEDGLIYTDKLFKNELSAELIERRTLGLVPNLPWEDLGYTEQGMQGDDYVSMILGGW